MNDPGGRSGAVRTPPLAAFGGGRGPRRGPALAEVGTLTDGVLAWKDGVITFAGPASEIPDGLEPEPVAGAVMPGFVDAHTHLPFFGWRADEFEARLAGRTYRDLQGGGGGIYRSSRMLREASDDDVLGFCRPLLHEMARHGTTALELKTGYGLSVEHELRQARLARRVGGLASQAVSVTLLACHAVPEGLTRDAWVDLVRRELIPQAAEEGLVDAVDVYVEDIAFTVEDLRAVADAAGEQGL